MGGRGTTEMPSILSPTGEAASTTISFTSSPTSSTSATRATSGVWTRGDGGTRSLGRLSLLPPLRTRHSPPPRIRTAIEIQAAATVIARCIEVNYCTRAATARSEESKHLDGCLDTRPTCQIHEHIYLK